MAKKNELECLRIVKDAYRRVGNGARVVFDNSDPAIFSRMLFSAKETGDDNSFPDFFCDGALIEHFHITSSRESRKGSSFMAKSSEDEAKWDKEFARRKEEFERSERHPWTMTTFSSEDQYTAFSYDDLLKSMKTHIENHIASLDRSGIKGKKVIFMMDQQDARLCAELSHTHCVFYLLSKDRKALQMLKRYEGVLDYIIYKAVDAIEIIDVSKIDEMIENGTDYHEVKPGRSRILHVGLFLDI